METNKIKLVSYDSSMRLGDWLGQVENTVRQFPHAKQLELHLDVHCERPTRAVSNALTPQFLQSVDGPKRSKKTSFGESSPVVVMRKLCVEPSDYLDYRNGENGVLRCNQSRPLTHNFLITTELLFTMAAPLR